MLLYLSCVRYANTQEIQHSIICSKRENAHLFETQHFYSFSCNYFPYTKNSYFLCLFVCLFVFWRNSPQWAMASSFMKFLDHTQRRTTVGRTPLDE